MRKGRAQKWRKMEREKTVNIRRAEKEDEKSLAYIQTESWKEAFKGIVPAELLLKCTELERATTMYKKLLDENKGNGYILELDGTSHCIAWWAAAREKDMIGFAASGRKQPALGAVEEMYLREL